MQLIDGKQLSAEIFREVKETVAQLTGRPPGVTFIRVGEDPASVYYVRTKERRAQEVGIRSELKVFPEDITQEALFAEIDALNADPAVDGILVQAPLPAHIDERETFNRVDPAKDVDGFHSANLGRLVQEDPRGFVACTPAGIVEMIRRMKIETAGKHVVVLGRSLIVGKPAGLLFMRKAAFANATVTVCHSRTQDLPSITRQADILIAAIGRPHFVTADMVKDGAVVVDVGINRVEAPDTAKGYRVVGDVDFDAVAPKTSSITPVPGGVGLMTVALLMANTLKAYQQRTALASP
ncbi:MAG: bifunctional methylenetetrahydrofolate dehydrogenase/methenyltetrahydrofolate cyclohydrolase FolD [Opitutales bacterium]